MVAFGASCSSVAVDPSSEPTLSESRQQEPAPPESSVLANLRSAEWAQQHGLPVNPHRGKGPSITFYGPGGSIRRHVELSEADLHRPPRSRRAGASLLSTWTAPSKKITRAGRLAHLANLAADDDSLTHATYTTSNTEQVWVYKYGALIQQSVLIYDGDTFVGASAIAYGENQLLLAEMWTPASAMPSEPPEPPDPEWEWETSERFRAYQNPTADFCLASSYAGCGEALLTAAIAGVGTAFATKGCIMSGGLVCGWARFMGAWFVDRVVNAIHDCGDWHTAYPMTPPAFPMERGGASVFSHAIA